MCIKGSLPAILYSLFKVHKVNIPMRPVLSPIGPANYKMVKVLHKIKKKLHFSLTITLHPKQNPLCSLTLH